MEIWNNDFIEEDILDSFDFFIENGKHKKQYYSLSGIINEFIDYMEQDIISAYPKQVIQIKKHIRGVCFRNKTRILDKYGE